MTTWHSSLYQHWYAVARTSEMSDRPLAVTVLDTHIALARDGAGGWIALEDRCPHRHAPLSSGCVREGGLACPYHGWRFGPDGALREIPGLPSAATMPALRVRAFPVQEFDGFLWLRPAGEGLDAPPRMIRETDPRTRRFQWQTRWSANVVDAMENFLDPMHTHFIHAGLVRSDSKRVQSTAIFQGTGSGFTVDYANMPSQSGLLYRLFESRRTAEYAHFDAPGCTRIEYQYENGSRILFDLHFTPRNETETDVFTALHVEGRWAPEWLVRLFVWPLLRKVNNQDAAMLLLQSNNIRRFGSRHGAVTELDIVRRALEEFWGRGECPDASARRELELML